MVYAFTCTICVLECWVKFALGAEVVEDPLVSKEGPVAQGRCPPSPGDGHPELMRALGRCSDRLRFADKSPRAQRQFIAWQSTAK